SQSVIYQQNGKQIQIFFLFYLHSTRTSALAERHQFERPLDSPRISSPLLPLYPRFMKPLASGPQYCSLPSIWVICLGRLVERQSRQSSILC
ncbi:hypothetical protein PFISCL1PPCAC_1537, partial [Pristionchus fissidentatus]